MNGNRKELIKAGARWLAPAFFALYLLSNLMTRSLPDTWMLVGWTALLAGVVLSNISKGSVLVFGSLALLLGFHSLAIPGSLIWGTGNWELTAGVVLWMAPAMLLYLANDARQVFAWLIPAYLVHAGLIIVEGLTSWEWFGDVLVRSGQNTGLANNPNLAAGFLIIGIIYLLQTRYKWLSLPLLVALLFTGSRWGLGVAVLLLAAMVLSRAISWRPLAGSVAALVGAVMLLGLFGPSGYQIAGYGSLTAFLNAVPADLGVRLAVPHIPSFLASGVAEHPGLHNVPLRIAVENGLLAAGLWVLITGWALLKPSIQAAVLNNSNDSKHQKSEQADNHGNSNCVRPIHPLLLFPFRVFVAFQNSHHLAFFQRRANEQSHAKNEPKCNRSRQSIHRWLLLALVLLSVLDYYTWMGHLGGFWWLLIGLLTKPTMRKRILADESLQRPELQVQHIPRDDRVPLA